MGKFQTFDEFLQLFPNKPRQTIKNGFNVICPYHNDRNPSLSVSLNSDKTKILLDCKADCNTKDVLKAVGLTEADLFLDNRQSLGASPIATFTYQNLDGRPCYIIKRFPNLPNGDKDFRACMPDGTLGIGKTQRILYNAPEVVKAKERGEVIYLVEGEKDVETLRRQGLVATTAPFGANSKWLPQYTDLLRGAHVVIVPDTDPPGLKKGHASGLALQGSVSSLKLLELQGGKDVTDWLDAGNTAEFLITLAKRQPEYTPLRKQDQLRCQLKERTVTRPMRSLQEMRDAIANEPETDDLIQDLLPDSNSAYMLIAGRSGIGKTFLLLHILHCLASGTPFMSRKTRRCKVGYLSLEGDRRKLLKRFNTIGLSFPGAEDNIFWEHRMPFRLDGKRIDWLTAKVDGLAVVGIDPLRPLVPGDYIIPKDASAFIENLRAVQDITGVVFVGSHHIRKPDKRIKIHPEDLLFEIKGAGEYVESATSVLLLERGKQEKGEFGKFVTNTSLKNLHFVKIKDAPAEPIPLALRFNAETCLFEPVDELLGDEA